ncbi:MAG: (deoxy)nucleoside triphosphate pyrophosphohydrolase [Treponema sp.]|jgi:8-oxo-dGTP diphosphatase|nr:(deoxy)nucleoside triphosphate pyrophosphohydrolase [Treponema sp.]
MAARSVAGIAIEGGKVFIARRLKSGDMGGKWEFPGGKVEGNETDEEALVREYEEEFGAAVRVGRHLGQTSFEHGGITRLLNAYRIYFTDKIAVMREHTESRWVSFAELETLDFADSDFKLFPFLKTITDVP